VCVIFAVSFQRLWHVITRRTMKSGNRTDAGRGLVVETRGLEKLVRVLYPLTIQDFIRHTDTSSGIIRATSALLIRVIPISGIENDLKWRYESPGV
jgi:hypothetical protein